MAAASAATAAAVGVVLLSTGDSGTRGPTASRVVRAEPAATAARLPHPKGVTVDCSRRSEANFPGAFRASRNLVVGPLVLIGGTYTPADVVREFGGNKFPLLVKAGHTVTVRVSRAARRSAGLAYAGLGRRPLPQGKVTPADAAHTMTFRACSPGPAPKDYRPGGPSGSKADGESVTFWSGFVLASAPACLPLEVYVDEDPSPRRVGLALGRRCENPTVARATCGTGGTGSTDVLQDRDVAIGPLALIGARRMAGRAPDAFRRRGYKIPVTLPTGMTATLSVPQRRKGRVGLVFSHRTQDRVWRLGVRGADTAVRFTACPATSEPGRTGWAGGLVVDRRRCAELALRVAGAPSLTRRVPLGRRC